MKTATRVRRIGIPPNFDTWRKEVLNAVFNAEKPVDALFVRTKTNYEGASHTLSHLFKDGTLNRFQNSTTERYEYFVPDSSQARVIRELGITTAENSQAAQLEVQEVQSATEISDAADDALTQLSAGMETAVGAVEDLVTGLAQIREAVDDIETVLVETLADRDAIDNVLAALGKIGQRFNSKTT